MIELPVFFPTSLGDAAGIITLPEDRDPEPSAVLLMPGDAHSRTRVGVLATLAKDLAASGYATLRFDYPGAGLSSSGPTPNHMELGLVAMDAAEWFLAETGSPFLLTAGHCLGARFALALAAYHPKVTRSVAVGCPVRQRKVVRAPVRSRLAAKTPAGSLISSVLTRGSRSVDTGAGWFPGLADEITTASERGRVGFIYGSEDDFYLDLIDLLEELGPDVRRRVNVSVVEGAQLRALTQLSHHPWVVSEMRSMLVAQES